MIGERLDPRKAFGAAVSDIAERDERVVVLSADSGGSSGFSSFAKEHPERYFEFGIMESCVVGAASGLSTSGYIPVFCAIAPFVTARPFEMFRNDLGYMRQNVKIVGRNGGLSYSDLGSTHHSLEDFALIRSIPGVVVLSPQDPVEIQTAARAMLAHTGPVYMRIGNDPMPVLFEEAPFEIGKGRLIRDGSDVTIITTGVVTAAVLEAAEMLAAKGIDSQVIGMPTIVPLDEEIVLSAAAKTGKIVTVEEHYVTGGLGSLVCELCSGRAPVPVKMLGVPHTYASSGPYRCLLAHYGLDAPGIARAVEDFVK
jgi:transketolase